MLTNNNNKSLNNSTSIMKNEKSKHKIDDKLKHKQENSLSQHWENISKMQKENATLRDELDNEVRQSQINEQIQNLKMEKMQEQGSIYAKKIEIETKRMRDLQRQIEQTVNSLNEKKSQLSNQNGKEVPHILKELKKNEYKLEKTRQKHNESLAEIKGLKEEVNASRRERVIFDNVFKNLEQDLKLMEEELKKYLFESLQVEHEKQLAQEQLKKIKYQSEKELKHFKKEYENAFKINHEEQQQLNMSRQFLDLDESKNFSHGDSNKDNNSLIFNKSKQLNRKTINLSSQSKLYFENEEKISKDVEQYEILIEKFKVEANVKDIDDFINLYETLEQSNQQLYEKSNEYADEIENLESQIKEMNTEIEKYKINKSNDDKLPQSKEIDDLKFKYMDIREKNQSLNNEITNMNDELNYFIQEVPGIMESLNINKEQVNLMLEDEINIGNIANYLEIIEKRSNEIIDLYNFLNDKNVDPIKKSDPDKSVDTDKRSQKSNRKDEKNQMIDLLEGVEKIKECEKIMSKNEFQEAGNKEIQKFKNKVQTRSKRTQNKI